MLDVEPSLTPEVVEIARWVADYYAAPLGEVMRAALPAGINTSIMQVVVITTERTRSVGQTRSQYHLRSGWICEPQSKALQIARRRRRSRDQCILDLRMGSARIPKWLRELESEGLIERSYRTRTTATRAKRQKSVRLIKDGYAGVPPAAVSDQNRRNKSKEQAGRLRTERETEQPDSCARRHPSITTAIEMPAAAE